jgi:hypothetical protein
MALCRAHLVVKVDGKRPVSVIAMGGSTMIAEITIEELNRVHDQVARMAEHWDRFVVGRSQDEDEV